MEELKYNKLVWVFVVMLGFNVFGFLMTNVVAEIAAEKAVHKLQMKYSPAKPPYGPGLNPDRISIERHRDVMPDYERRRREEYYRRSVADKRPVNVLQSWKQPPRDALWRHSINLER